MPLSKDDIKLAIHRYRDVTNLLLFLYIYDIHGEGIDWAEGTIALKRSFKQLCVDSYRVGSFS